MSSSSSFFMAKQEILCYCNLPTRLRTSRTDENPGRKFRTCPNSMNAKIKCPYWEWVDPDPVIQVNAVEAWKEVLEADQKEVLEQIEAGKNEVVEQICKKEVLEEIEEGKNGLLGLRNEVLGLRKEMDEARKTLESQRVLLIVLIVLYTLQLLF